MQRFRTGAYAPCWVAMNVFLIAFGLFCVVGSIATGLRPAALVPVGAIALVAGVAGGPGSVNGLRAVQARPGPDGTGTISVPVWGWRTGFGRTIWPLAQVSASLSTVYSGRDAHVRTRLSGPGGTIRCDGITCAYWRRGHPNTAAARAVERINELAQGARNW